MRAIRCAIAIAVGATFGLAAVCEAQPPFVFKFKPQMKLRYETTHETTVEAKTDKGTDASTSTVKQVKEWTVTSVDSLGVATLEMAILRLSLDQTGSDGERIRFDSNDFTQGDKDLAEQLGELIGKPVLRVQLAANGQVKESQSLSKQKQLIRELPFYVTVPEELPRVGLRWQRDFAVTLEPPLGTGHAYKAVQVCQISDIDGDLMAISSETKMVEDPKPVEDRISMVQYLPSGTVLLDWKRGLMVEAKMSIDEKVPNIAGEGTHYSFQSRYHERLMEGDAVQADQRKR